ncbi:lysoplasmalogenase [Falsigemmobacter faecalis]|uniref:Lysoplasmalogenase n=1 Tax=Falsigemmobacter faecalis TaxID=2488730 RepID=A0A3P3DW62_9RHOB|nr:lysoplasmalogenase [Falsigemmobacter faecalis]RRH78490.1 lysoplasmalogenase [Falsigemmobacter faecalis]
MIATLGALGTGFALVYWLKGRGAEGEKGLPLVVAKTASTACLALAGLLAGINPFLTAGLAFGALGDFALTQRGQRAFLAGLVAFAIGHLLYIPGFLSTFGPPVAPPLWAVALLPLFLSTFYWLLPHAGALRLPVMGYAAIICLMTLAALCAPAEGPRGLLWPGVLLFVASDVILALRLFRLKAPRARQIASLALWPLYFAGQGLILLAGLNA